MSHGIYDYCSAVTMLDQASHAVAADNGIQAVMGM
jgi:hypothetical protein